MKTYNIIFSPTGGTAKAADAITKNWADTETIDLSDNGKDFALSLEEESLALISMPCFGGVAPQLALDRLSKINAHNSKCAIVAVYGNRAYGDTLVQMYDYAQKAGFKVIAAVSAVAEHSIVHEYATNRPDENDIKELQSFGDKILKKAQSDCLNNISIPGNRPYKKAGSAMVPKASSSCTTCGLCAKNCPAGAIDPNDPHKVDKKKCIGCMRCVALCPVKARSLNPIMTKVAAIALKKECSKIKKNELFI